MGFDSEAFGTLGDGRVIEQTDVDEMITDAEDLLSKDARARELFPNWDSIDKPQQQQVLDWLTHGENVTEG